MKYELLNLIPDDLLNLIWRHVKPSIKYKLNKQYFEKFFGFRFSYINITKQYVYINKYYSTINLYIIKNFNYITYLIKHDLYIFIENIISYKITYDKTEFIFLKLIIFKNKKFKNFIEFCYYYSKKFDSQKIHNFICIIIKKYKLTHLIKKEHKNNSINKNNNKNKNIKWII